jgi:pimeloyl-ACP methyl ester carboxylesterase
MNPDYIRGPSLPGTFEGKECTLYFERRGVEHAENVVLIMGAFATMRHYDELADILAKSGYNVLTYDHRGIGKSSVRKKMVRHTSTLLANDCVDLLDHVFGRAKIHVYGAWMGRCVAQYVALALKAQDRLSSLYLAVTSRGSLLRVLLPQPLWKLIIKNFILKKDPEQMVRSLVPKCFSEDFLRTTDASGRTMHDRFVDKWTREYPAWFSFADPDITASQCSVFATHYLSSAALRPLLGSPVTVHIAEHDDLMPPSKQRELAAILAARVVSFASGHMAAGPEHARFLAALLQHLRTNSESRGLI